MINFTLIVFFLLYALLIILSAGASVSLVCLKQIRESKNQKYRKACLFLAFATSLIALFNTIELCVIAPGSVQPDSHAFPVLLISSAQSLLFTFLLMVLFNNSYVVWRNIWPHLLPTVVCITIYLTALWAVPGSHPGSLNLKEWNHPTSAACLLFACVYCLQLIIYTRLFIGTRRAYLNQLVKLDNAYIEALEMGWVTKAFFCALTIGILAFLLCFNIAYAYKFMVKFCLAVFYGGFSLAYVNYHFTYEKAYNQLMSLTPSSTPEQTNTGMEMLVEQLATAEENDLFRRIERFMEEKPYVEASFDRKKLSQSLYTNERYLAIAIQAGSGLKVKEYIDRHRIDLACNELHIPGDNRTIEEIALACGFSNARTFYRLFRDIVGMTPDRYRREQE